MSYRDVFVNGIKEYYQKYLKTHRARITITQNEIGSYLQHLKADIAKKKSNIRINYLLKYFT